MYDPLQASAYWSFLPLRARWRSNCDPKQKGAALIALLATSRGGERTRSWLQDRLWGSRQQPQAQASLRNEMLKLRQKVNVGQSPLIAAEGDRIRIDLAQISVDITKSIVRRQAPKPIRCFMENSLKGSIYPAKRALRNGCGSSAASFRNERSTGMPRQPTVTLWRPAVLPCRR